MREREEDSSPEQPSIPSHMKRAQTNYVEGRAGGSISCPRRPTRFPFPSYGSLSSIACIAAAALAGWPLERSPRRPFFLKRIRNQLQQISHRLRTLWRDEMREGGQRRREKERVRGEQQFLCIVEHENPVRFARPVLRSSSLPPSLPPPAACEKSSEEAGWMK